MSRSFLVYWLRDQVRSAVQSGPLNHAGSDQLNRCDVGDVLWVVGPGRTERLVTVGSIEIAELVGQRKAAKRLPYKPWAAKYHALADPERAVFPREVSLDSVIEQLEFISATRPRLDPDRVLGQQLQRMRELTAASAELLHTLWESAVRDDQEEFDGLQRAIDNLGPLDVDRQILARREQSFLRRQLLRGDDVGNCAICGNEFPAGLLVAAHIKPRSRCSDRERRDYRGNVVLMCRLGCDALFEAGFVAIDGGTVKAYISQNCMGTVAETVQRLEGTTVASWTPQRTKYFDWHLVNIGRRRNSNRGPEQVGPDQ